jgi:hypothetical protein
MRIVRRLAGRKCEQAKQARKRGRERIDRRESATEAHATTGIAVAHDPPPSIIVTAAWPATLSRLGRRNRRSRRLPNRPAASDCRHGLAASRPTPSNFSCELPARRMDVFVT